MDYKQSISDAIAYIEANLQEDIGLAEVARVVYFSPFHFSRVFTAMVGDSVSEYLRKRRLANAGDELLETDKRVIDIAFDTVGSLRRRLPELLPKYMESLRLVID